MEIGTGALSSILNRSIAAWGSSLSTDNQRKALALFSLIRDLPILDIHTHYATTQIVTNTPWATPTEIFLGVPNAPGQGFDHYAATVMLGQGVSPLLVYGRCSTSDPLPTLEFEQQRFEALVGALADAYPNPTSLWFELALHEVFGINIEISRSNAATLWEAILEKLQRHEFSPQELLNRNGVRAALTTDSPEDSLSQHAAHRLAGGAPLLLPTWRPDRALYPESNSRFPKGDFLRLVSQLSEATGDRITSIDSFLSVLQKRMSFFAEHGCRAADFGIENFPQGYATTKLEAAKIFDVALRGSAIAADEADAWKGFLLSWFAVENARRGWVQYFHQGATRNINSLVFNAHGRDVGVDAPGGFIDRSSFGPFLDFLSGMTVSQSLDGTALAKTVIFPINPEDYTYVLETVARFNGNSAGIKSKVQLGPPWWFNDTVENNSRVIRMVAERGVLNNWVGMLSDARCLPSVIARIKQFRAILAVELVRLLPHRSIEEILPLARRVAFLNADEFLGGGIVHEG